MMNCKEMKNARAALIDSHMFSGNVTPAGPQITESRIMDADDLRALCIRHNWYTCGTCEEYERLFSLLYDADGCPVNLTTAKLAEIAQDIMEHSEITDYTITSVMYELNRTAHTYFDIV